MNTSMQCSWELTSNTYSPHSKMATLMTFLTGQMSAKAGLKELGEQGGQLIMKELEQLLYREVIIGQKASSLSPSQWKAALQYLMFLKEK